MLKTNKRLKSPRCGGLHYNPSTGKERQVTPWGSVASQPGLLGRLQLSQRLSKRDKEPKEQQHLRLSCGLYIHTCVSAHKCTSPHTLVHILLLKQPHINVTSPHTLASRYTCVCLHTNVPPTRVHILLLKQLHMKKLPRPALSFMAAGLMARPPQVCDIPCQATSELLTCLLISPSRKALSPEPFPFSWARGEARGTVGTKGTSHALGAA